MKLFADASYFIALAKRDDKDHAAALGIARRAHRHRIITHSLALGEIVALVGPHLGGRRAREVYDAIRDSAEVMVPTLDEMDEAMSIVLRHDGRLSLSDALLVLAAKPNGDAVLSFDADFDRAGVKRVTK